MVVAMVAMVAMVLMILMILMVVALWRRFLYSLHRYVRFT